MYNNILAVLLLALTVIGCSPTLYPLYRDYEHNYNDAIPLSQIEEALIEAGWELLPSSPPNAISTVNRQIRNWLLYKVVVQVEAVPIGVQYVRLFVHPYRVYPSGSRSKIPFLKRSIRRRVIRDIDRVFEAYGLIAVGTDMSRDEVRSR